MKRGQILFLRAVILLLGVGVLALMLWEPHLEGRNANADLATIYFRDPFLAYAYTGSLPFFYGLYQAFMLLGYVGRGEAFSPAAVRASRRIKYCALLVIGFIAAPWPTSSSMNARGSRGLTTTTPAPSRWAS